MDIESLRSLLAFVETGSITRASKQANRTQAAVSMQMKKLEAELGKPLFEKQGRHLYLTADGQQLARYARRLVSLHDETLNAVKFSSSKPLFRIGCPDDYVDFILPKLLECIDQLFQDADIQVVCAPSFQLRNLLDTGHLDLAVVSRVPTSEEGYLIVQGKGVWAGHQETVLENAPIVPLVVFEQDCKFHQAVIEGLIKQAVPFKILMKSQSFSAQRSMLLADKAICAIANFCCTAPLKKIESDRLPELPIVELTLITPNAKHALVSNEMAAEMAQLFTKL